MGMPSTVCSSTPRIPAGAVATTLKPSIFYSVPLFQLDPRSVTSSTVTVAFTSSAPPSFPIPALFNTTGTEAPFSNFTVTGFVTAS